MSGVSFVAYGTPSPAGSKTVGFTKTGRHFVRDSAKNSAAWKRNVAKAAGDAMVVPPEHDGGTGFYRDLLTGPLSLRVLFVIPRPKGHYGTGRNARTLRLSAPVYPTVAPDATKLLRAVEDACQGIVYANDSAIVTQHVEKRYGNPARVEVSVATLEEEAT